MAATKTTTIQKPNFAERTAERVASESVWKQYNSQAKFYAQNMTRSLEELAKQTFPTDAFNSNAYQEAIVKSLVETISPEVGIKDFWKEMNKAKCASLSIIDGHLTFFDHNKQKLDITPFTQAIIFEAHSSYYKQRMLERQTRIMEARRQLESLIKEIHRR